MPVPTTFADLSTTVASNSPSGSDSVFPDLDNYIRFINAALASIQANSGNGWTSPYVAGSGSFASPSGIGTGTPNSGAFTTLSSSGLTTANSLTVTNASTFAGVASFTATPAGAGMTARFATPGPIGSGTASTGQFTTCTATTFSGSGASLTNIPAGQLTGDVAQARLATTLNASGSAPFYVARAWINFNGTGTPTVIGTPGNMLTSITDNGAGDYTLFFDVDMPNADYVMAGSATGGVAGQGVIVNYRSTGSTVAPTSKTTSECRIRTSDVDSGEDAAYISVVFFC